LQFWLQFTLGQHGAPAFKGDLELHRLTTVNAGERRIPSF
jgi:hypothetical protein